MRTRGCAVAAVVYVISPEIPWHLQRGANEEDRGWDRLKVADVLSDSRGTRVWTLRGPSSHPRRKQSRSKRESPISTSSLRRTICQRPSRVNLRSLWPRSPTTPLPLFTRTKEVRLRHLYRVERWREASELIPEHIISISPSYANSPSWIPTPPPRISSCIHVRWV
jgi:hypothetical protein